MKWDMEPRPPGDAEDAILICTSNPYRVYRLDAVQLDQQIDKLVEDGQFDVAREKIQRSIANLSSQKQQSKLSRFDIQVGIQLMKQLEFHRAIEILKRGELDPREYLSFFPQYHSSSFAYEPIILNSEAIPRGHSTTADIKAVIAEGKRRRFRQNTKSNALEDEACEALISLLEYHLRREDGAGAAAPDSRTRQAIVHALFHLLVDHDRRKSLEDFLYDEEILSALDMSDAEKALNRQQMYGSLAIIYEAQNKADKALKIYERIGKGDIEEPSCDAVEKSIHILRKNRDEALIWKYSTWILKTSPSDGLMLFAKVKPPLDSEKIMKHLKRINHALAQSYLESVVNVQDRQEYDDDMSLSLSKHACDAHHTKLALEYIEEVLEWVQRGAGVSDTSPGSEPGALGKARKRLILFLKSSSSHYDSNKLITKLKKSPLREEFFILCGKSERHEDALAMLWDGKEVSAAVNYCLAYGRLSERSRTASNRMNNPALLTLFNILMKSKEPANMDKALKLLSRYAKQIDPLSVLSKLPESLEFAVIEPFLSQAVPHSAHILRETMLSRNLSNVYNLQMQYQRAKIRAEFVPVEDNTVCMVCRKRIGDIVFASYPNGTIAHYNCTNGQLDNCPISGNNFA